jgi:hypothetical protein
MGRRLSAKERIFQVIPMAKSWFKKSPNKSGRCVATGARRLVKEAVLPCFEGLESRFMYAVQTGIFNGELEVAGDGTGNVITIDHSGTTTTVAGKSFPDSAIPNGIFIAAGDGNDLVQVQATAKNLIVNGGFGKNNVILGKNGNVQGITAPVTIVNVQGNVTVDDHLDPNGQIATLDVISGGGQTFGIISNLAPGKISYRAGDITGVKIVGSDASGNVFTINNTVPGVTTTINTGFKDDSVTVRGTTGPLTINGETGNDFVHVGGGIGSVQQIRGEVTVTNSGAFTSFDVDDSQDAKGHGTSMGLSTIGGVLFGTIDGLAPARIKYVAGDVSAVSVKGGSGGNSFHISDTATNSRLASTDINTGAGVDQVFVTGATGVLKINGNASRDTLQFDTTNGTLAAIKANVIVNNTSGRTQIVVNDQSDKSKHVATLAINNTSGFGTIIGMTPGVISYVVNDLAGLTINGGNAGNAFTVADTASNSASPGTVLNTGTGNDSIKVLRTTGSLQINGQGSFDSVAVGLNRSTAAIKGSFSISNDTGTTSLFIDDAADASGRGYQIGDSFIGLGTTGGIFFDANHLASITLNGSDLGGSFFVSATRAGMPVTINGGVGTDTFHVGSFTDTLDTIQGPLTVNGEGGTDSLFINDQGSTTAHTYSITATSVARSGAATINYTGIENLQLNKGPTVSPPLIADMTFSKTIVAGTAASLSGHLVDSDKADNLSLTVDWGDGSKPTHITPDRAAFTVKHAYAKAGKYTVRAIWTDSTGDSNFKDLSLAVLPKLCAPTSLAALFASGRAIERHDALMAQSIGD